MPSPAIINGLSWWVRISRRFAWPIVVSAFLLAAASIQYTRENLGINTDTADMIARDLPWRQTYIAYKEDFPQFVNTLLIVIDGASPDAAEEAAARLGEAIRRETGLVEWVDSSGVDTFFRENGLLFLDVDELEALADRLARIQPFLGSLMETPTTPGFFELLERVTAGSGSGSSLEVAPVLAEVAEAAEASNAGRYHRLSWQSLMGTGQAGADSSRRYLRVKPKLNYAELFPAGPLLERIKALSALLDLGPHRGVRVRITGGTALAHEELQSVTRGAALAAIVSLVMVTAILLFGLRSVWLKAATLITLALGLCWTAAFATFAVGHLNLISVAFAVLYIGLGVSYAIHYCLRCHEVADTGAAWPEALDRSARDVGAALTICAVTTGIGFFAFVPTDFTGVSELGIISGTGMFISLAATLTVLPALLSLFPVPKRIGKFRESGVIFSEAPSWSRRHRRLILGSALVLALLSFTAVPYVRFDDNPLNLRDPESESVSTFRDLMSDGNTSPWTLSVMSRDLQEARALRPRLERLSEVGRVSYVETLVPGQQSEKLALIEDLGLLLSLDGSRIESNVSSSAKAREAAARELLRSLEHFISVTVAKPARQQAIRLQAALEKLLAAPDSMRRLSELEQSLMHFLPAQLMALKTMLQAKPVALDSIPRRIRRDWVTEDGRFRVEVAPAQDLDDGESLARFMSAVRGVAPDATGAPVVNTESGNAIVRAFIQALISALALIALLLIVMLRNLRDVTVVLAPLLFATLLTVACMVVLGVQFNFANVIALPLLLGIGVDNGIHMVYRWRSAPPTSGDLLQTSTARGVIISALTTICSFGNLAYSPHRGTASMGLLLTLGLGLVLVCTLLLIPALQPQTKPKPPA
jgi:hypothetical protein